MNEKIIKLKNNIRGDMEYLEPHAKAYARIVIKYIDDIFGGEK